ncbi:MAG: discoidin domain-containing protein, partial [Bacteroidales bacterium]|nr:discoidin domain-containing protein [Bacteroidales bacterium]
MKKLFIFLANLFAINVLVFACDTTQINKNAWSIVYISSEELTGEGANNGHGFHCFDGDSTTFWHSQWQNVEAAYPHEIQLDLGDTFAINGFSLLTRASTNDGRINDFLFYVTNDTNDWGTPQAAGQLDYPNVQSSEQQTAYVFFGTVAGRYVRLVANSSVAGDVYAMIAELDVYQDTVCPPTGQNNQVIQLTPIPRQFSTNPPFVLEVVVSSGLPLQYEVVNGPATISDSLVTLTGEGGDVI